MPRREVLQRIGYIAFGFFSLVLCLYWTFPADAVAQRLSEEVRNFSKGQVTLTLEDPSSYWFTGIEADGVRVDLHDDSGSTRVHINGMSVRLQVLPLLLFRMVGVARLHIGEGELKARVTRASDAFEYEVDLDEVNLGTPPLFSALVGFPLNGELSGHVELKPTKDITKGTGKADLSLHGLTLGPGEPVKGFSLPNPVSLGDVALNMTMANGRVEIDKLAQDGKPGDVALKGTTGRVNLRGAVGSSTYDFCTQARFEDSFLKDNKKFEAIMDFASVSLQKDGEGFLHIPVSGSFSGKARTTRRLCDRGAKR